MRITIVFKCIVIISLAMLPSPIYSELYSALIDLERAVSAEQDLFQNLFTYIRNEELRLAGIRVFAEQLRNHSAELMTMQSHVHLSNPVNAFMLVKRFALDWKKQLDELIKSRTEASQKLLLSQLDLLSSNLPNDDDLKGAIDALLRLQDTYQLPTQLMAKGHFGRSLNKKTEIIATEQLSADECVTIALHAWSMGDSYHTRLWMSEALEQLGPVDFETGRGLQTTNGVKRSTILDYLIYSKGQHGQLRNALALSNEWLMIEPEDSRAQQNKAWYDLQVTSELASNQLRRGDLGDGEKEMSLSKPFSTKPGWQEFLRYEALCRGEIPKMGFPMEKQRTASHKLFCHLRVPHPHYILGPLREEDIQLNPLVVMWHNVLHPQEIKKIQAMAEPRLNRATVQDPATGKLITAHYRVSKSAWLKDDSDIVIHQINQRIGALTGLKLDTAEDLQVVNYGIGGQYEPHYDFARRHEVKNFDATIGNRIATLLFYMSDVAAGGATVFTELGFGVSPMVGSAAFWYNLHRNGDGIMSTRHAACPVLFGNKWVMNKWFHERGQEFSRPCALNRKL